MSSQLQTHTFTESISFSLREGAGALVGESVPVMFDYCVSCILVETVSRDLGSIKLTDSVESPSLVVAN